MLTPASLRRLLLLCAPLGALLLAGPAFPAPDEKPPPAETPAAQPDEAESAFVSEADEAAIRAALARRSSFTNDRRRDVAAIERAVTGKAAPAQPTVGHADLIGEALARRGARYVWGGASRGGFDCSGFTMYLYDRQGVQLPHSASAQARHGQPVAREALVQGDLVFFRTNGRSISHVGVYIGNNKFIHASSAGRGVRVDELTGYYARTYVTARRIPAPEAK